ncbi:nitrogen fixation protein NifQ [Agarivorans sp. DSG3-1]|uniref:nitrogen fixation protein NifQ n=1 Tax=Agarivorans sp. DSG3-1 TaxID=3342249 RepID=UPI00398E7545
MEQQVFDSTNGLIGNDWMQALTKVCYPMSLHNRNWFKQIISAQLSGEAALPYGVGLDNSCYLDLKRAINNSEIENLELLWKQPFKESLRKRANVLSEVCSLRAQERNELIAVLVEHANHKAPYALQMAIIVATACLSQSHLWRSLGLKHRDELGALLKYNFPELHAMNTNNMRWKRFFYRYLCQQGGDFVCRAPSCAQCPTYSECFV